VSRSNVIELNGKRYDARSGKMLSSHETGTAGHVKSHNAKPVAAKHTGVVLDGFTKRLPSTPRTKTTAHAVHHKTEKSKTLMRTVVKKPETAKSQAKSTPSIKRHPVAQYDVDPRLKSHAEKVKKSSLVSRFGAPMGSHPPKPIAASLEVRPEPEVPPPVFDQHHLSVVEKKSHSVHMQRAMENSKSHTQPKAKKQGHRHKLARKLHVTPKIVSISAMSFAVFLLVGFIAYQNVPNFSMRVAAARAGVDSRLPDYQPSGFGMSGPIQYKSGQVVISYRSHSDDRNFSISQRSSQWNSETLLENYVVAEGKSYQTFQDGGKTIYIYDENSATWVDGGVWYQIEGKSSLTSDQLLRVAASM
jgi:hypothetical protein